MCGIVGFINQKNDSHRWGECLGRMTAALSHRGPDDEGQWFDAEVGVAFGHRRLSILDLSPEGHQPMTSVSKRYEIVFNGEIYNFGELRADLEALSHQFRGHSDTEVMLAAFEQWGIEASVKRFTGMFAFALWDRSERTLYLVRDRLGEKPLYYGWMGNVFLFGSELKSLRAHPAWQGEIDPDVVAIFMRHNYIPAPYSIYKGIRKLQPGTILTLPMTSIRNRHLADPVPYWSAQEIAEAGINNPFEGSDAEAIEQLDHLLRSAVRQQMVADVPLGAFLSGGIDSSTIVALMQAQSNRAVKTFTIGFNEKDYNEAEHAKAVAAHLGTDHTELYLSPEDAMTVIPQLASIYDEPFSDSSQIPTLLVSKLARRQVTVCLSGDGGDELFCGYRRYATGRELWGKINHLPTLPRLGLARALRGVPIGVWDNLFGWASPLFSRYGRPGRVGDKMHKVAEVLDVASPEAMYRQLCSHCKQPTALVSNSNELASAFTNTKHTANLSDVNQRMMFVDTVSYLPDNILVKLDRASMAVSLESRVPFLDHRIVEFAWRVPMKMKVKNGQGKWLLYQLLQKYLPKPLIERPKMGFGVPIGEWLRGPLRDWAESLLDEKRLREEGVFNHPLIREKWLEHLSGNRNWQYYLWDALMFQAWFGGQKDSYLPMIGQRNVA